MVDENVRGAARFSFFPSCPGGRRLRTEKDILDGWWALRAPNGAGAEKLAVRLLSMSYAFISLNPGLWSPLTVETKEERSRAAS